MLAALGTAVIMAGCGSSSPSLPDLSSLGEVHAISREEGSGTRNEFERLVGTDERGARDVATSTTEAVAKVAADPDAVAYVAYSAVKDAKGVKILAVDTIKPSVESIRADNYPLTRTYYLCWNGELQPAEQDLLSYIQGAGQSVIERYAISLKSPTSFLSSQAAGTVHITGSTSMEPLMKAIAEEYGQYNSNAVIDLKATDSTEGLTAAIRGEADMAMSSRQLKSYEAELLQSQPVARDGIAIIVNEKNPLTNLTKEQIQGLFNGSWKQWGSMK